MFQDGRFSRLYKYYQQLDCNNRIHFRENNATSIFPCIHRKHLERVSPQKLLLRCSHLCNHIRRHDLSVDYRRIYGIATCNGNPVQSRVNPLIFMVSVSFHPLIRVIFNFRSRYLFAIGLPFQYLALEEIQLPYSDCTSKQPYSDLKAIYTNLSNRSDCHRLCIPRDARFPTCFIGRFA